MYVHMHLCTASSSLGIVGIVGIIGIVGIVGIIGIVGIVGIVAPVRLAHHMPQRCVSSTEMQSQHGTEGGQPKPYTLDPRP